METFQKLISSPRYWLALVFTFAASVLLISVPEESLNLGAWFSVFFLTKVCAAFFALLAFFLARTLFVEFEGND